MHPCRPDPSSLGVAPKWVTSWKAEDPVFGCGYMRSGCTSDARQVHRDRVRRRRLWERLQRRQSRLTRFASHHCARNFAKLRRRRSVSHTSRLLFGRSWARSNTSMYIHTVAVCANFCHRAAVAFEKCILNGSSCPENRTESELRGRRRGRGRRCAAKGGGTYYLPIRTSLDIVKFCKHTVLCAKSAVYSLSCADTLWDQYYPGLGPERVRSKVGFHGLSLQFWNFRIRISAYLNRFFLSW